MNAPLPRPQLVERVAPLEVEPVRLTPWAIIASRPGEAAILLIIGAVIITAAVFLMAIGG